MRPSKARPLETCQLRRMDTVKVMNRPGMRNFIMIAPFPATANHGCPLGHPSRCDNQSNKPVLQAKTTIAGGFGWRGMMGKELEQKRYGVFAILQPGLAELRPAIAQSMKLNS